MYKNKKEMIASLLKEGRLAKGYTQKELSELSNISVRSIQRIENGELIPRSYTLKTLAGLVDIAFASFSAAPHTEEKTPLSEKTKEQKSKTPFAQKIVLSIGGSLVLVMLSLAFLAQSKRFPETQFEYFIFWAMVMLMLTGFMFIIWRSKK